MQLTSPAALYSDWNKEGSKSYAQRLLDEVPASARLVTVLDGHPAALAWMGYVTWCASAPNARTNTNVTRGAMAGPWSGIRWDRWASLSSGSVAR
jgi:hypothetical protein